ncbi:uncharacterized protein LOC143774329 [Ranitomeya variabilis]|uniref:uncharacterized protein LOC143774329 n=1 Tax=Ranitomeya variabilis TaxID=490064 RepID=UPI0040564B87
MEDAKRVLGHFEKIALPNEESLPPLRPITTAWASTETINEEEKGAEDGYDPVTEMREEDTREENTGLEEEESEDEPENNSMETDTWSMNRCFGSNETIASSRMESQPPIRPKRAAWASTETINEEEEGEVDMNLITPDISEEDGGSESTELSEGEVVMNVITPDVSEEDGGSESTGLSEGEVVENAITPDISEEDGGSESTELSEEEEGGADVDGTELEKSEEDPTRLPKLREVKTAWANTEPIPPKRKWWIPKCFRKSSKNKVRNMNLNDSDETAQRPSKLLRVFLCCCTIKTGRIKKTAELGF